MGQDQAAVPQFDANGDVRVPSFVLPEGRDAVAAILSFFRENLD